MVRFSWSTSLRIESSRAETTPQTSATNTRGPSQNLDVPLGLNLLIKSVTGAIDPGCSFPLIHQDGRVLNLRWTKTGPQSTWLIMASLETRTLGSQLRCSLFIRTLDSALRLIKQAKALLPLYYASFTKISSSYEDLY